MGTLDILRQKVYGRTWSEQKKNVEAEAWETPRGKGASAAGGKDGIAREQFAAKRLQELGVDRIQKVETHSGGRLAFNPLGRDEQYDRIVPGYKYDAQRRSFLKKAIGIGAAGGAILVAANSRGIWDLITRNAKATPGAAISGPVLSASGDIDAKRIGGVRYATEFDTVTHAGTNADPFTFAAISGALADGTGARIVRIPASIFDFATQSLTISPPGSILEGAGSQAALFGVQTTPSTIRNGTLVVQSENIKFRDFYTTCPLYLQTKADLSDACHYFRSDEVDYAGQVFIRGALNAVDAKMPFNIQFVGGELDSPSAVPLLVLDTNGGLAPIAHVYFLGTNIDQQNNAVSIQQGAWIVDCHFIGCLLLNHQPQVTWKCVPSSAGAWAQSDVTMEACDFETTNASSIVFQMPATLQAKNMDWTVQGGGIRGGTLIDNQTAGGTSFHNVNFRGVYFPGSTWNFNSTFDFPTLIANFDNCFFVLGTPGRAIFTISGGAHIIPATFTNCVNVNPFGLVTNAFISTYGIGLVGTQAGPSASSNYIVTTFPVFIYSTGGTGVSIVVKDQAGNVVPWANGVASLSGLLLPVGWQINWGAFSVAPTVSVFGN